VVNRAEPVLVQAGTYPWEIPTAQKRGRLSRTVSERPLYDPDCGQDAIEEMIGIMGPRAR